ncbi:MAG TPA: PDZ domain-containing protein [Chitinophagaceae bacterium]|nr:PDZ domain-containing protein [Chitinophagaceae bacterium]
MRRSFLIVILVMLSVTIFAQDPFIRWTEPIEVRYSRTQPVITYTLSIDSTDTSSYNVDMEIQNVADTFSVAMMAHPEYDDRYWRFVEDFHVNSPKGPGYIIREDSALWRIITHGNSATLHYRIHFPVLQDALRSSWKAFLTATGGLVGGPHSFMYVVGATLAPCYVVLKMPLSWKAVTGLEPTFRENLFFAPSVHVLMDDPIFVGQFKTWTFDVNAVPHRVVYWPLSSAEKLDSTKLVSAIQKLVEQALLLFGRLPYREYSFMLQDGAIGALEHNNSVTIGAPSSQMEHDMTGTTSEIAHEYFHTWNLMRIHPVEYGDVNYKAPQLSRGLWFSEGITMFYADLFLRRAGLPTYDSTRIKHLETLIRRYLSSPAYSKYSAERISLASYGPPGMLGDYSASTHLQGEILATLLDLIIRNASNGKLSFDDVMRKMMEKFSGEKGFTSQDIERVVHEGCGCGVHEFFTDYVYGHKQIDFNRYLALIGLRVNIEWKQVVSGDSTIAPDLRVYSWQAPNESFIRLGITNPASCWGQAGLHTGDIIKSVNESAINSSREFRQAIRQAKVGDTISIQVRRPSGSFHTNVAIKGYQQPEVRIVESKSSSQKEKSLRNRWKNN